MLILSKFLVSKIQKSTSEDKQDLESIIWQEILLNEYAEANQRRRSKRIDNKRSKILCVVIIYFIILTTVLNEI